MYPISREGGIDIEIKPKYLVMVTASANNNKYYRMIPHGENRN